MMAQQCASGALLVALLCLLLSSGTAGARSVADVRGSESGFSSEEVVLDIHDSLTYDQHRRLNDGTGYYWCVSKDGANVYMLQTALNWTCSSYGGGVNCNPIYAGGNCYLPNTIQKHSSWAFNVYYNSQSGAPDSCNFSGTAMVTVNDPSTQTCLYQGTNRAIASSAHTHGAIPAQSLMALLFTYLLTYLVL